MSVIHMVACGMIAVTESNFKKVRREVRLELQAHGMRLHTGNNWTFSLAKKRGKGSPRRSRRTQVHHGDFISSCKAATEIITPSDHENV